MATIYLSERERLLAENRQLARALDRARAANVTLAEQNAMLLRCLAEYQQVITNLAILRVNNKPPEVVEVLYATTNKPSDSHGRPAGKDGRA